MIQHFLAKFHVSNMQEEQKETPEPDTKQVNDTNYAKNECSATCRRPSLARTETRPG